MTMREKFAALVRSRRFQGAALTLLTIVVGPTVGLSIETTLAVAGVVSSWIVGDSLRKTE